MLSYLRGSPLPAREALRGSRYEAMLVRVGRSLLLAALLGDLVSSRVRGRLCFNYVQSHWPHLWNKQSLAWGDLFCPAPEPSEHLGRFFLQGSFLAARLSPSRHNHPACLLLLQKGCAEMGSPGLFCLCPGVGVRVLQGAKLQSLRMSCLAGFVLF